MKKWLILFFALLGGLSFVVGSNSVAYGVETVTDRSQVGISFVEENGQGNDSSSKPKEDLSDEVEQFPQTGEATMSFTISILSGVVLILGGIYVKHKETYKEEKYEKN